MDRALVIWGFVAPFSMALTNISLVLMLSLLLGGWSKRVRKAGNSNLLLNLSPIHWSVLALFFSAVLSSFSGLNPPKSFLALSGFWDLAPLFFIPLIPMKKKDLTFALSVFLQISTVVALYAIFQFFFGTHLSRLEFSPQFNPGHHARAFFSTKLTYGGFASTAFILSFIFFVYGASWLKVRFPFTGTLPLGIFPILLAGGVLASGTRSYWIGLLAAFSFFFLFHKNFRRFIVPMGLLLLGLLILSPPLKERVLSSFSVKKNMDRIFIFQSTLSLWKFFPWLGIGNGNTDEIVPPFRAPLQKKMDILALKGEISGNIVMTDVTHAHNNVLQILLVYGIVGLVGYLVWAFFTLFSPLKASLNYPVGSFEFAFSWALLLIWINFHVGGFFEHSFGDSEIMLLLSVLTGFSLNPTLMKVESSKEFDCGNE